MVRLKTFAIMLLVTTVPAAYSQSAPTKVTVGGTSYNVLPQGRSMLRVDDLDGHMIGMGTRTGSVIAPQAGPAFDIVKGAIKEFLNPTSGASSAHSAETNDPDAALGARVEAITTQVQGRVNGTATPASDQPVVKSFGEGSIVITDPKLGDVTFTDNGMKATWTVTPKVPQGMPIAVQSANYTAFFEGGEKPASAGKKLGKAITSGAVQTLDSLNTRADAVSGIGANPDKVWRVNVQEGNKKRNVYESGEYRSGGFKVATGRDPAERQGISILLSISQDWGVAKHAIEAAQKTGQATTGFDFTTDRYQRGSAALQAATKGYDIQ
jgi:hypothetical protein